MKPEFDQNRNVRTWCDRCDAVTVFEKDTGGSAFGVHGPTNTREPVDGEAESWVRFYRLSRCSGCARGGLGEMLHTEGNPNEALHDLRAFYPTSIETLTLPSAAPQSVAGEFDEAARCANAECYRGASALLRSALEKTLNANGFDSERNLFEKIEAAAATGIITSARRQRAHDHVRVLGNDIVHDEWREVDYEEFDQSYRYTQRVIEDFYEHRAEVEKVLTAEGRNCDTGPPSADSGVPDDSSTD